MVEYLIHTVWREVEGFDLLVKFDIMTYRDAMTRVSAFALLYVGC